MSESATGARRMTAREREERAMQLRKEGKTYREIGRALGITDQGAHKAVMRALKRLNERINEEAEDVRRLELERLDEMLSRIWPKVKQGRESAIDRALRIMKRRAELLGLDAPTRTDVTSGGEQLKGYVIISPDDWERGEND